MHKFKVGDKVTCLLSGDGVVTHSADDDKVSVKFVNGENCGYVHEVVWKLPSMAGKAVCNMLYPRGTKITIEESEPVIPENTLVWGSDEWIYLYVCKDDGKHRVTDGYGECLVDRVFLAEFNDDGTVKPFEGVGCE